MTPHSRQEKGTNLAPGRFASSLLRTRFRRGLVLARPVSTSFLRTSSPRPLISFRLGNGRAQRRSAPVSTSAGIFASVPRETAHVFVRSVMDTIEPEGGPSQTKKRLFVDSDDWSTNCGAVG